MKKVILYLWLFCIPFMGFSQTEKSNDAKQWEFNITPFLWMTALKGDISILNQQQEVNVQFKDVLDHLKMTATLHAEAKNGNWSIMLDALYSKLKQKGEIQDRPTNIVEGDVIEATLIQRTYELGVSYTFVKVNNFNLDALVGGRLFSLDTKLDNNTQDQNIFDKTIDFIDPYFGVRFENKWEKWAVGGRIDVGGFGAGSEISYKYNVLGGYQFSELFQLIFGYQCLKPDYVQETYTYNVGSTGPIIGFNFSL